MRTPLSSRIGRTPVAPPWPAGFVLLVLLLASTAAPAAQRYAGSAYSRDGGRLLYREVHWRYRRGGQPRQLVLYQCPDGRPFARKRLAGAPDDAMPDFDFVDARSGYREGAHRQGDRLRVYVQRGVHASRRSAVLPLKRDAVVDAGFDAYVRTHWQSLARGDVTVPFLLPSHLDYVGIRLGAARDERTAHGGVRHLRMRLAAWYGFAVPAIHLAYSLEGHRLLRFEGIGSIRDGHGHNQDVRIDFPASARDDDVPQSQVDAALATRLDGRCDD